MATQERMNLWPHATGHGRVNGHYSPFLGKAGRPELACCLSEPPDRGCRWLRALVLPLETVPLQAIATTILGRTSCAVFPAIFTGACPLFVADLDLAAPTVIGLGTAVRQAYSCGQPW